MFQCFSYLQLVRVKMSIKVRVNTCFQIIPKNLRHFNPKPYYDVEMPNWWNVADLHVKLFTIWNISCLLYKVEFYRDWFDEGKLSGDDNVEDGTTLFAVISLKEQI